MLGIMRKKGLSSEKVKKNKGNEILKGQSGTSFFRVLW
jgi:hypothetical protein